MDGGTRVAMFGGIAVLSVFVLSVVAVGGAAAQPSIGVAVNGSSVDEGANVTVGPAADVNVTATSDEPLAYVDIGVDGRRTSEGGQDKTRFALEQTVDVGFGVTRYTVTAVSDGGRTEFTVRLERPATDRRELRQQLREIRSQLRLIEDSNEALEQEKENLTAENERLRQRLNETDNGSEGDQGLPGFGPAAALVAIVGALAAFRRR